MGTLIRVEANSATEEVTGSMPSSPAALYPLPDIEPS